MSDAEPMAARAEARPYRLFSLDNNGRISTPPKIVECADDKEAMEQAVQLLDGHCIEVWDAGRLVIRLAPQRRQ